MTALVSRLEGPREAQALLRAVTLDNYMQSKPPCGLLMLSADTSLATALHRLALANVVAAPVVHQSTGDCLGFLDIMDILSAIFEGGQWMPGISAATQVSSLATFLQETTVADIPRSNDAQLISHTRGSMSLLEICRRGFVAPTYKLWCHRIAVFDKSAPDAAQGTRSGVHITSIFSQYDVAKFLYSHAARIPTLMTTSLASLGLGQKAVFSVSHDMPAADAFRAMLGAGVTAAAVLEDGQLVGNLSPSDLRGLSLEDLPQLNAPVLEFLAGTRAGVSTHVVGSLASIYGVRSHSGTGFRESGVRPAACGLGATLGHVLRLVVEREVHRVYLLEESTEQVAGVVSLTDILTAVIGP